MTRMLCIALLSIGFSIANAADMRVFGFEFGKPIRLPECQLQPNLDEGQKIYLYAQEATCLEVRPRNIDDRTSWTWLRFSEADWPQTTLDAPMMTIIQSDAGALLGVRFQTSGVQYQDAIYDGLRAKYGKPTQFAKFRAQNAFGAASTVIHAKWSLPGLRVVFDGADTTFDSGTVTIDTPEAEKARVKWELERNKGKSL
jgi:hypothetical protein